MLKKTQTAVHLFVNNVQYLNVCIPTPQWIQKIKFYLWSIPRFFLSAFCGCLFWMYKQVSIPYNINGTGVILPCKGRN